MKTICIKSIDKEKINYLYELVDNFNLDIEISKYRFKVYDNLIIHYENKEYLEEFYDIMTIIVKKCIEYFYEEKYIRNVLDKNYFYLSSVERNYICEISKKVLELPDEKIGNKNFLLKELIKNNLKENKYFYLEGFVNFRIKKYKELLERIVEVSVFSYLDLVTF